MAVLLAIGVLVFLPALQTPFFLDDFLHVSMIEGTYPASRGPFDLYNFIDDAARPTMVARGLVPWWSHPSLTLRFFRPLASALIWLDHKAFGHAPLPMHLHSLVWWALAVVSVGALLRRLLPVRTARIATVIFALAACHAMPIAWLANREALESLASGGLALFFHTRSRDGGVASRRALDAAAATACFAIAIATGGEYAIAFGGYVLARELTVRGEPLARRALAMFPFALPAALYLAVRTRLGYGSYGSGFYTDPLRAPLDLLRALPWRSLALVANGWLTIDSRDFGTTAARLVLALLVVVALAFVAGPTRRAVAALDAAARANVRWLFLGSLLAMTPMLAVVPSARVLGIPLIGIASVVAVVLDAAWFERRGADARTEGVERLRAAAIVLGFAHLVHGPGSAFLQGLRVRADARAFVEHTRWLGEALGDPSHTSVAAIRGLTGVEFAPFALDPRGVQPARWRVLSETSHVLAIRRDARTVELVAPKDSSLYPYGAGSLFRTASAAFRAGDHVEVPGMRATIVAVGPKGPRDVVFRFDEELESAANVWFTERYDRWQTEKLPLVGFGAPFDP